MHRYRTISQISLILSILNLVLAAPIVVQEIHETRGKETAVPNDVAAMPTALDRPTSPGSSPDAMGSPQHSSLSDGSTSSGYPAPYLSEDESVSGYSWLLNRPPRLNLDPPASMHGSAPPHPSSSRVSVTPIGEWLAPEEMRWHPSPPVEWQGLEPDLPHSSNSHASEISSWNPSPPGTWEEMVANFLEAHPPHSPQSSHAPEIPPSNPSPPATLEEMEAHPPHSSPSSHASEMPPSDHATTGTYSPQDRFTPSHDPSGSHSSTDHEWRWPISPSTYFSSASDGPLSTPYFTASEGPTSTHSSPAMVTVPQRVKFFNEDMVKKLKIAAGMLVVGGAIAGIVGSQVKKKHRDLQDS